MSECIFCSIAEGREHGSIVHADDQALVMLDLFPVRTGHGLVLLRRHAARLEEMSETEAAHLFNLAWGCRPGRTTWW
jgi:histidine triad (HIT) family protein